ncbi:MAG: hypothetical protein OEZ47_13885, partial [Gammaproteobacteria bacterium]|nr:hypothetical protein [Gammaproteobacteria bacterium]
IPKWRSEFKDVLNPPGISSSPSTLIAKLAYQLNQELGLVSETRVNRFLQANELLAEIEALNIHETGVATRLIHLKKAIMLSERLLSMKAFKACQQAIDFTKRVSTYGSRQLELDLQLLQAELDNRSEQSNSPFNLIDDAIRKAKMLRCAHILVKGQMILQHKHLASGRLDVVEESFELLSKLCYRLDFPILHLHFGLLRAGFADKKHKNATPYLSIAFDFAERQGILPRYWIDQQALIELLDYGIRNRVCESHCRTFVSSLNLVPQNPRQLCDDWPWAVRIYTFGRFAVLINEEPLILSGKSHQKPLQVLKAIIAFGGRNVSERLICDTLWPGSDRDSSYRTLSTNLHRLRKILGRDDIVEVGGGHVTLNSKLCWVDCWAFEILVNRFHSELASGRATQSADAVVNTMFKLYHGSFLRTDVSTDWIRAFHYKLQSKFSRTISSLGTSLEKLNKHDDAFDLYQRALEIEPSADLLKLKLESGLGANREHSLNG